MTALNQQYNLFSKMAEEQYNKKQNKHLYMCVQRVSKKFEDAFLPFCLLHRKEFTACSIECAFVLFFNLQTSWPDSSYPQPHPPTINWKETIQSSAWGPRLFLLNTCLDCDCCTITTCPLAACSHQRTPKKDCSSGGITGNIHTIVHIKTHLSIYLWLWGQS